MTQSPLNASILIVTYNSAAYLDGCLASVSRESGPEDEIILVDNASTDGSAGMIRMRWPEAALVRNRENLGFAAAANQAARRAQKDMLAFLNPDTVVLPGWLDGLRQALRSDQRVALATSKVLPVNQAEGIEAPAPGPSGQAPCGQGAWLSQSRYQVSLRGVLCRSNPLVNEQTASQKPLAVTLGAEFSDFENAVGQGVHFSGLVFGRGEAHGVPEGGGHARVSAASGASFAVRRDVWHELGGFDETFWMYYEETDLSWRAWRRGYRCVGAPESVILHDPSSPPSGQTLDCMARNRYLLLGKNFHPGTLLLLAPGIILAEAVDWGRAWLEGRRALSAKLRAGLWLLAHVSHLATNREGMKSDLKILEACTYRLEPRIMPWRWLGRTLLEACNALFWMNYRVAVGILRRLGR